MEELIKIGNRIEDIERTDSLLINRYNKLSDIVKSKKYLDVSDELYEMNFISELLCDHHKELSDIYVKILDMLHDELNK